ncbi:hypothetical protein [Latilactobacillus fuchuensis]|uniref:hypothetical protein n=1 Tax=Latilactobacillus fuchuensis TaxID=164393 RepID=UPI0039AEB081
MDLEKFKPVILTSGPSTMTIAKSGVSFSQASVIKLNKSEFVRILMNSDDRMILIEEASKEDEQAVPFFNPNRKVITARWNYSDFNNSLSQMMEWDTDENTYKVHGTYLENEKAMLFDLNKAQILNK